MRAEDVRLALRRLWMQPARTLATVGMLAIAVGLTTAVFTVADALVFTPVPFPHADRLTRDDVERAWRTRQCRSRSDARLA
jgi:hypothetical protein